MYVDYFELPIKENGFRLSNNCKYSRGKINLVLIIIGFKNSLTIIFFVQCMHLVDFLLELPFEKSEEIKVRLKFC